VLFWAGDIWRYDGQFYTKWTGTGWGTAQTADPRTSPDNTLLTGPTDPGKIIDGNSPPHVWQLTGQVVTRDGSATAAGFTSLVVNLLWYGGLVYQTNAGGGWWYAGPNDASGNTTWVSSSDPRTAPPVAGPVFTPGWLYVGVSDRSWPAGTTITTAINDVRTIFGSAAGSVVFGSTAYGGSNDTAYTTIQTFCTAVANAGMIPLYGAGAGTPWNAFPTSWGAIGTLASGTGTATSEAAAYAWAYARMYNLAINTPACKIYKMGNEWDINAPTSGAKTGDGHLASQWTGPLVGQMRGIVAASNAAIIDTRTDAISNPSIYAGWTYMGILPAVWGGLNNYTPPGGAARNLMTSQVIVDWHWYVDACVAYPATSGSCNSMGPPESGSGYDLYATITPLGRMLSVTEMGSRSTASANNGNIATNLKGLLDDIYAHRAPPTGNQFVELFQLYSGATYTSNKSSNIPQYSLMWDDHTIAPAGLAVQQWLAAHGGNPAK
jgi:hypothetical protein